MFIFIYIMENFVLRHVQTTRIYYTFNQCRCMHVMQGGLWCVSTGCYMISSGQLWQPSAEFCLSVLSIQHCSSTFHVEVVFFGCMLGYRICHPFSLGSVHFFRRFEILFIPARLLDLPSM